MGSTESAHPISHGLGESPARRLDDVGHVRRFRTGEPWPFGTFRVRQSRVRIMLPNGGIVLPLAPERRRAGGHRPPAAACRASCRPSSSVSWRAQDAVAGVAYDGEQRHRRCPRERRRPRRPLYRPPWFSPVPNPSDANIGFRPNVASDPA
jgi:hypothetical protein